MQQYYNTILHHCLSPWLSGLRRLLSHTVQHWLTNPCSTICCTQFVTVVCKYCAAHLAYCTDWQIARNICRFWHLKTTCNVKFARNCYNLRFLLWGRLCRTEAAYRRRIQAERSLALLCRRPERRVKRCATNCVIRCNDKLLSTEAR